MTLSRREQEVMEQLAKGRENKEIGFALGVTVDTVKSHLRSIYTKLGVSNRTEALLQYQVPAKPPTPPFLARMREVYLPEGTP